MKKIIAISICIILLFTGCTRENNVKNNSSTVSLPSQTELTIKKLLDYIKENKFDIFYNNSFEKKYDDNFKIAFQDVYGDEEPELVLCLGSQYYSHGKYIPEDIVSIYTVENDKVVRLGNFRDYGNYFNNDKYYKFPIKKNDGKSYLVSTRVEKYDYDEFYKEESDIYDKNSLSKNDYLELTFCGVYQISKSAEDSYPGDFFGFQTIKATSQQVFFYSACSILFYDEIEHLEKIWIEEEKKSPNFNNEKRLSEYFVKECEKYKNPDTGLYELYTVEKDIVDKLWGEKDYPLSFLTGDFYAAILPKEDFEKLYAEYMSNFKDYNSKVYMSKELTLDYLDLDKIEKEAVAFFSEK